MFAVGVSDHVMIAHSFADPYFGPAQKLHGATFAIELEVRAPSLGPHHVVMDIGALRSALRAAIAPLDYANLDDHPAFPNRTSTTERVAEHVARAVRENIRRLPDDARPVEGSSIKALLRESPTAWASFDLPL